MTFPDSWFNSANSADRSTGGLPFGTSFSGIISISSIGSDCTGAIKFLLSFFSINNLLKITWCFGFGGGREEIHDEKLQKITFTL